MKRLFYILLAIPFVFSCQFQTPKNNTMERYAEELCEEFLRRPAEYFSYGSNAILYGWTEYDSQTELKYTFVPVSDHSWQCSIVYLPDTYKEEHRMDGSLDATLLITGLEGDIECVSNGAIMENNGYTTIFRGELRLEEGGVWKGYFRVELCKNDVLQGVQEITL